MSFPGTYPNQRADKLQERTDCEADFSAYITTWFPQSSTIVQVSCKFGADPDDVMVGQNMFSGPSIRTTDNEALGEQGAIAFLQGFLASANVEFQDNSCFTIFRGSGAFNIVYFNHPTKPTAAILLEAKGGNSTCGWRTDDFGSRNQQGTPEYAENAAAVMGRCKTDAGKNAVGKALLTLINQQNNSVAYIGVRTKYNAKKQEIHDPIAFFFTNI